MSNVRYVNIIKVALFIVALYKVTSDPFIKKCVIGSQRSLPPVMRCADRTTLWRALRLIQPDRMLSIVNLYKLVRVLGDKPNFLSLLRLKRHCYAFFTKLSVWVDHFCLSVLCTPRNL